MGDGINFFGICETAVMKKRQGRSRLEILVRNKKTKDWTRFNLPLTPPENIIIVLVDLLRHYYPDFDLENTVFSYISPDDVLCSKNSSSS